MCSFLAAVLLGNCVQNSAVGQVSPAAGDEAAETPVMGRGLVAHCRSLAPGSHTATWHTLAGNLSLFVDSGSPHPRLPPGPFEVVWTGWLEVREAGPFTFSALVSGTVELAIDGHVVLRGGSTHRPTRVESPAPVAADFGQHRISCTYRSPTGHPAQLQLWWEGERFYRERLPTHRLGHLPADLPADWAEHIERENGRELAESYGCARCHRDAFPAATDVAPGPAIDPAKRRYRAGWLHRWLSDPSSHRSDALMPALFAADNRGALERWVIATYLADGTGGKEEAAVGDHRAGRQAFAGLGCAACHLLPEGEEKPADPKRRKFVGLADRFTAKELAAFLLDPLARYPDGRMPRFPLTENTAADLTAYLLLWSKPTPTPLPPPPTKEELQALFRELDVNDVRSAAVRLIDQRRCGHCHPGLGANNAPTIPIGPARTGTAARATAAGNSSGSDGCLGITSLPRFALSAAARRQLAAFLRAATMEQHPAPAWQRQRLLERSGCFRCHADDGAAAAPLEVAARSLWVSHLVRLPHQRTPTLAGAVARYTPEYLTASVRDGVTGVRPKWYSYRMPMYGGQAEELVRALAEREGETHPLPAYVPPKVADPTLHPLGPTLIGTAAYACVSCHVWKGDNRTPVEPGAAGPELTTVVKRVRREWFDRWLADAQRLRPGTPMPTFFAKGQRGAVHGVLDGDPVRQRDALWAYFAQGAAAPDPKPQEPIPLPPPAAGQPVLVSQIPLQIPAVGLVESLCVLDHSGRIFVFDLAAMSLRYFFIDARLERRSHVHWRLFEVRGTLAAGAKTGAVTLVNGRDGSAPRRLRFDGYDRLPDGVRLRYRLDFPAATLAVAETLRLDGSANRLLRSMEVTGVPAATNVEWAVELDAAKDFKSGAGAFSPSVITAGTAGAERKGSTIVRLSPDRRPGRVIAAVSYPLPRSASPSSLAAVPATLAATSADTPDPPMPGYRAVTYRMPKLANGEDGIMPTALAVDRRSRRLFIASAKMGELFVLANPDAEPRAARFDDYAGGLFQDVFGMLHDAEGLHVLHRRNLTLISDSDGDGRADRFDRRALLPHAVGGAYDWAYGLVRQPDGAFLIAPAPHANRKLRGSGGVLRIRPGSEQEPFEEVAFGLRNALGWCSGPDGAVFFTDNQGEWVAANKVCHLQPGRFYGYPNAEQPEHARRPAAPAALWVPYDWARSINGIAFDDTAGKFGPFAGQLFLAELMHGGAILRASLENVNGTYQGACFPFWGRGLLGPLVLAFDPIGRLYVGSITEPGWMAQPDRGGLFAIEFIGPTPFEIATIRVRPRGFRLEFTRPVDPGSAQSTAAYRIEHYRYEYTSAYGSPELERTALPITRVRVADRGRSVELSTGPLMKGRVYAITAGGVRSQTGASLVHPTGAYTLNEIPADN